MILSASRRTDIPAYYSEWFLNRLKEGYVLSRNPMNHSQISKIILSPYIIDCIVFWTKDPANMMDKFPEMNAMGYHYYFQFTITPYDREMEHNLRDKSEIANTFIQLSKAIGKDRTLWRYDPIILNEALTLDYHATMFETLCRQLCDYTNICTISFVDLYSKLNKAVKGNIVREITKAEMISLAEQLVKIGRTYEIEIRACSEMIDFTNIGIQPASCIDRRTIEKVCGYSIEAKSDKNQRPGCGCIQSVDIGAYNTCRNGCVYCYANHGSNAIENNWFRHNHKADLLIGTVGADEKIILKRESR